MPESTSPTPLPPSGGESHNPNPSPHLALLPDTSPRQVGLTRRQMEAMSLAVAILDVSRKPVHASLLAERGITAPFLITLEQDIARVLGFGRTAVRSGATGKDATQGEEQAHSKLLGTLREIQSAARLQHLPNHPQLLENYYIGRNIAVSRAVLESISQIMIDQANEERPGSIDTGFIERAQAERTAYLNPDKTQHSAKGQGKEARRLRDEAFRRVITARRKIQYAADVIWPCRRTENEATRAEFRLSANRPYSH
jgi:hypothetical protein